MLARQPKREKSRLITSVIVNYNTRQHASSFLRVINPAAGLAKTRPQVFAKPQAQAIALIDPPVSPEGVLSIMAILQQLTALACDTSRDKSGVTLPARFVYGVFLMIDSSQFTIAACIAIR